MKERWVADPFVLLLSIPQPESRVPVLGFFKSMPWRGWPTLCILVGGGCPHKGYKINIAQ